MISIKELTVLNTQTLKDALVIIDQNAMGVCFVVDKNQILVGILSDGDIRRALLNNVSINDTVLSVTKNTFFSLPIETDNYTILKHITNEIKIIPLIDKEGILIDYASIQKIRHIAVASPFLSGNELAYVTDCIKTNWISSQGKYVRDFEELFVKHHSGRRSLAVSNGTVALHLALEALNIGADDEVLVPDLTFAASVNAIVYTGATPVLVDVDPITWNIDVAKAAELITSKTKAIMPVHLYGLPCDMEAIQELASAHNLLIVEDCAEALGSYYDGKPVGTFGDVATFSFYGNKTITTGEGGMIVFKDPAVAERAAMLRDHGMQKTRRYWHQEIGYNYRLTNLQAAIGVAQFERLDEFVSAKIRNADFYNELFSSTGYFEIPARNEKVINSYWLYTCMVNIDAPFTRDELIDFLGQKGVETRPVFFPMHVMPPYKGFTKVPLPVSASLSARGMSFPSSVSLTDLELTHIRDMVNSFMKKFK